MNTLSTEDEVAKRLHVTENLKRELAEDVIDLIESRLDSRPTSMEFEMAYQARIAIDRIRFAIKHTEQLGSHTHEMRDAGLQLLDALQRLESVDRRFQARSQSGLRTEDRETNNTGIAHHTMRSPNLANGRDKAQKRSTARTD